MADETDPGDEGWFAYLPRGPVIHTPRLRLRQPSVYDVPALAGIHADPRTNTHRPDGPPSLDEATAMVTGFVEAWEQEGAGYWLVESSSDGRLIGVAGVRPLTFRGRECWNLYYRFSPDVWGAGLATEAVTAAVDAARATPSRRPVVARTRPTNEAAQRLAERVGLQRRPDLDEDGFVVFVLDW